MAVKIKYAAIVSCSVNNANLTTSKTAGWMSAAQDNTSNKYLDALVQICLASVNSAPSNTKAIYIHAYGLNDSAGAFYTGSGSGTPTGLEGTITFPDFTSVGVAMPRIGVIPYAVQNVSIASQPFSVAAAFNGVLPPKYGVCMINDSGMTLAVNNITFLPVYVSGT